MTVTPAVEELPLIISVDGMDADECYRVLRGNAVDAYGLERFGIHD